MDEKIEAVKAVITKYCVPNKDHDGVTPRSVAEEVLKALNITE